MIETIKLLEYIKLCGHRIRERNGKLVLTNGSQASDNLKTQIRDHKDNILYLMDLWEHN